VDERQHGKNQVSVVHAIINLGLRILSRMENILIPNESVWNVLKN